MNTSLAALRNPYDFANPVSEAKLFAGRRSELADITYYVNMAAKTERPINLALLGERASGKTSLLNMTEHLALELRMVPVRIDLDESDIIHQFALFIKIFTAILTNACQHRNAFGGLEGRTFQAFLEMMSTLEVPEDRSFCSFLFPIQYAKTNASGRLDQTPVIDDFVRRDLSIIKEEAGDSLILLFDECNVLSGSGALLQKLRNIFMNMNGFMLVFAGTPELFPVLDEVFSPISRQFKRIEVTGFRKIEETLECIRIPLTSIEVDSPEDVFDFESEGSIREIHHLTGGRPYEIQLVCHAMFRRLQEGRSQRMALDSGVLEDVRRDLIRAQSADRKALFRKIQELSDEDLLALAILCGSGPSLRMKEIEQLEYLFHGETRLLRGKLRSRMDTLVEEQLLKLDNDERIEFCGDQFDLTYLKYLLKEREIDMFFRPGISMEYGIRLEFLLFLLSLKGVYTLLEEESGHRDGGIQGVLTFVRRVTDPDDEADLFREYESEMDDAYEILFRRPDVDEVGVWNVRVGAGWWSGVLSCYTYKDERFEKTAVELRGRLGELQERGKEVGVDNGARIGSGLARPGGGSAEAHKFR